MYASCLPRALSWGVGRGLSPSLSLCSSCPSSPAVRTFEFPDDFEERLKEERIGATTQLLTQADFPLQAYEPKVQVPFLVLPGQCPRKIEIERYGWWAVGGPVPTTWGGGQRAIQ